MPGGTGVRLAEASALGADPFRMLARPRLGLCEAHPLVHAARDRARRSPELAALLLTRGILVERGMLDRARAEALTTRGLSMLRGAER